MDERLLVIGADSGNGYTKIDFGPEQLAFPSLVAAGNDRQMARLMEHFENDGSIEKRVRSQIEVLDIKIRDMKTGTEGHYFCGSLAAREGLPLTQWSDDKGANKAATALLLSGIAAGMRENKAIVYLAASLPVKNFKRFKDSYEENLTGTFEVEFLSGPFEGITKTIQIIRCRVYPEGMGVYVREIHDQHRNSLLKGYQALIAPGFRTTEFIIFSDGKPVDDLSGSFELGMATAHKRVANKLSANLGVEYSEHDIDTYFLETSPGSRGEIIKRACATELPMLAEQIVSKLRVKWQDIWLKIDSFLVSDGGGSVLFKDFEKSLTTSTPATCILVENPGFATAIGNRTAASLALAGGKLNGQ